MKWLNKIKDSIMSHINNFEKVHVLELRGAALFEVPYLPYYFEDVTMTDITSPFSKEIIHIFLTRVSFILNKIQQTRVLQFNCDEFTWVYVEPVDDESLECVLTIHQKNKDDIYINWSGDLNRDLVRIVASAPFMNALDVGDNLTKFTEIETFVTKKLIALEKDAIAAAAPAIDFKLREEPSQAPSIADQISTK